MPVILTYHVDGLSFDLPTLLNGEDIRSRITRITAHMSPFTIDLYTERERERERERESNKWASNVWYRIHVPQ